MNLIQRIIKRRNYSKNYNFVTTKEERDKLCISIINSSSPKTGFYLLLILSIFIMATGLIKNNLILIIGGMMVAPLLSPVLSISLALTILHVKVFIRSIMVFLLSTLVALIVSSGIGSIISFDIESIELIHFMNSFDITTFLIPVAAGAAAGFTWAKKELNSSLSGVAVTVTLLPPLVSMGLALAIKDYAVLISSLNVYLLNVSGIILGGLIVFLLMGFHKSHKTIVEQVEIESEENS